MRTTAIFPRLLLICCCFLKASKAGGQLDGLVRSECRDQYLWIQVASAQKPRFEAVDQDGVHSISEQLSLRCGYTISAFKMDGFTTFRASYYSCFTNNQNDELFTFRFNVIVSDGGGRWSSRPISTVCSGLSWTHREITCEEDYMEVNVNRESSCGGQRSEGRQEWQKALFQAQKTASVAWQLMFLQNDGRTFSMSIPEAQKWGYGLTATANRVVFRSPHKQPHAEVTMVEGIPVKVLQVFLFFKQKLLVVMIDMSMVCTVNSGSFDGTQLLWNIPQVLPALVGNGARFQSQSFKLGLGDALLDEATAFSKGLKVVQEGGIVKVGVPVGTEGGYRKSLVEENVYKEVYTILLMYEHVFSLVYEDDNAIDTKHRILKVLETPLICHPPFSLNQTISKHQMFSVYLGNIPADVLMESILINGKMLEKSEQGLSISSIVHLNGSQAYKLQLPFDNAAVHWTNVGGGVVQYSIDINFTLTIMPQKESYFHQAFITAQVFNAFPPEITAQCLDGGILFSVVRQSQSLWEVGIDNEPLTAALVAQRGYHLLNDSHRTTLEVPVFSVGYTYEEINLSNFYATFKLLLRNSKTLEVQASTSKRCLFRTEDMIVCSADGTMTVVATPASTWPSVQPERTSLLDHTCKPKQTNGARVLFEFKLNSCGTKAMIGDWYAVYENEILHDRLLIADGPNFISREPQFKVTVRCFYPLSAVNRVSMDRIFTSANPGFGSVRVFKSHRGSVNKHCSHQHFVNGPKLHPNPATGGTLPHLGFRPRSKPGPSHFITVPGGQKQLQFTINQDQSLEHQTSQVPQSYRLPHDRSQWEHLYTPNQKFKGEEWETSGPTLGSFNRIPDGGDLGKPSQKLKSLNSLAEEARDSGLPWDQSSSAHRNIVQENPSLQRLPTELSFGMTELSPPSLSLHGPSGELEVFHMMERPVYQNSPQTHQTHLFMQPQDYISNEPPQTNERKTLVPADFNTNIPNWSKVLKETFHNEQGPETSRDVQNLESLRPFESTVQSRVQNIRVKPPSKYVSFVPHLNQKPVVHRTRSQNSNPSQYPTVLTAGNGDGNQRTRQQTELGGSNTGEERVHKRPDVLILTPKQVLEKVQVQPDRSSIKVTNQFPNQVEWVLKSLSQTEPQPMLVQSLAETENQKQESVPGVPQTSGVSHIRIRPAGLPVRTQTPDQSTISQNQEYPTNVGGTRMFHQSSMSTTNSGDQNLTTGGAKFTLQTYSEDSEPMTQSWLGCGGKPGQDGASVHGGIFRGKPIG